MIPIKQETAAEVVEFKCATCNFLAKSAFGLGRHISDVHGYKGIAAMVLTQEKRLHMANDRFSAPSPVFSQSLTRGGVFAVPGPRSLGDTGTPPVRPIFELREYPQAANMRDLGPSRAGGLVGGTYLPIVTTEDRNTGRKLHPPKRQGSYSLPFLFYFTIEKETRHA